MSWHKFFGRKRADADLIEEIESYIAEETAENKARGMSEQEAMRRARIKFGNPSAVRESLWRQNTIPLFDNVVRDLRYAMRTLRRTPGFTLISIGVMALCIGATTSLFTVVRSILLKPLPFRDPDRLVMVYEHFRDPSINAQQFNYNPVAPGDFYDWRAQTHGFEDMAVLRYANTTLTGERGELPEQVIARAGSWNLFPLLGVDAAIGRTFTESEDRTDEDAVMLTWSLFERRFGGDRSIVGKQIHLDGKPHTVVGVLPSWFNYPDVKVQLWIPYRSGMPPAVLQHHDFHFSNVVARLRPGVSLESALSQVEAVQYRLHLANQNAPVAEDVASRTLSDDLAQNVKKPLTVLLCAVGCMLLIGCLNVANLLVARSAARQKELALRSTLGAQWFTLIRGQMMESLLISIAGGAVGILLSLVATRWLVSAWTNLPTAQSIDADGTVLTFACALIFATALLAGLLPAISSTRRGSLAVLQASSRTARSSQSRTAMRKTLLTVEIAATVVLLFGAGLLLKSFWRLRSTDLGCVTDNMLTMNYSLRGKQYDTPEKANAFNEKLLERLRVMPGVRAVALGSTLPGSGDGEDDIFAVKEHPPTPPGVVLPDALYRSADAGFFNALKIPLLNGRFFSSDDRTGRPQTIIISHLLAQQYFSGENPLGKHLRIPAFGDDEYEIVGVVGDTLYQVGKPLRPIMYLPVLHAKLDGLTLAVITTADPLQISIPVQKQFAALDPQLAVSNVLTLQQIIERSLGNASLSASLVLSFAVLSLVLASVGLYGVLSYIATQRTGEIGIRMALGAPRQQILSLMLGDGLRPAIYGLLLGLAASAGAIRLIQSMLYGTQPLDPAVIVTVIATLLVVAAIACLIPAWKSSRIDPMVALRME